MVPGTDTTCTNEPGTWGVSLSWESRLRTQPQSTPEAGWIEQQPARGRSSSSFSHPQLATCRARLKPLPEAPQQLCLPSLSSPSSSCVPFSPSPSDPTM